jgi:hypothetical protein
MIGLSTNSEILATVAATYPDPPINVVRNSLTTTATAIGITWTQGTSNGGSPVLDYLISFDQGTENFVPLATGIVNSAYVASGLVSGNFYSFRVQARNAIGYSQISQSVKILAATVPNAPISVSRGSETSRT